MDILVSRMRVSPVRQWKYLLHSDIGFNDMTFFVTDKLKHNLKEINLVDGTSHKLSFVLLPGK
jgi:hypothetical protein